MRPRGLVFVGWLSVLAAVVDGSVSYDLLLEGSGADSLIDIDRMLESTADERAAVGHDADRNSSNYLPSSNLTKYLLSKHNVNAPPDGIIDVYFEMEFVHILGIDEIKQTMTALVYIDEKWLDPSLSWNPDEYSGLTLTWLPLKAIWLPDIIIFNMVSASRLMHDDMLSSVRAPGLVYSNGMVEISHPAVYTVSCTINIKNFPLDHQKCSFEVASWAYGDEKIKLHAHSEHSGEHFSPNEEWELMNISISERKYVHEGILVSEICYDVDVKRKPLFYMVTLTFPSYVMCSISIIGLFARFSTTGEREERFTLGVTSILTMAVLSLVVSEKVPHSSTAIPLLVGYFLFNMVTVSVAAMTTGLVMRVHRKGRHGRQPPLWMQRIFCVRRRRQPPRVRRNRRTRSTNRNHTQHEMPLLQNSSQNSSHNDANDDDRRARAIQRFMERLVEACNAVQEDAVERNGEPPSPSPTVSFGDENGWVLIAYRLDWIFMLTYITLVTIPVLYLFANM